MVVPLETQGWLSAAAFGIGLLAFAVLIVLALLHYRRRETCKMLQKLDATTRDAVTKAAHAGDTKEVRKLLSSTGMKSKYVLYHAGFTAAHIASIKAVGTEDVDG